MEIDMPPSPVPSSNQPNPGQNTSAGEQSSSSNLDLSVRAMDVDKPIKKPQQQHVASKTQLIVPKMTAPTIKSSRSLRGITSGKKEQPESKNDIGGLVVKAVRSLKESSGSTARDIKKYLAGKCGVDVKARSSDILLSLKSGVQAGQLLKEEGKYKAAAKKRRSGKKSGGKKKSGGSKKRGKKSGGKRRKGKKSGDADA